MRIGNEGILESTKRQGILKLKEIDGERTEKMCNVGKNKQITTRSIIIKMT